MTDPRQHHPPTHHLGEVTGPPPAGPPPAAFRDAHALLGQAMLTHAASQRLASTLIGGLTTVPATPETTSLLSCLRKLQMEAREAASHAGWLALEARHQPHLNHHRRLAAASRAARRVDVLLAVAAPLIELVDINPGGGPQQC